MKIIKKNIFSFPKLNTICHRKVKSKVHPKGAKSIGYNKSFYPKIVRRLHEHGYKLYRKICTKIEIKKFNLTHKH